MVNESRKVMAALRYVLEILIPCGAFVCMFVTFIIGVFMRYIIRNPLAWTYELSQICFLWTGVFGVCTAQKKEDHIIFSMVYDELKPRGKNIMRIISSCLVLILTISIAPSIKYLFSLVVPTSVMGIPKFIVFSPYVIMLIVTVLRYAFRAIEDIRTLKNKTYDQKYNTGAKEVLI